MSVDIRRMNWEEIEELNRHTEKLMQEVFARVIKDAPEMPRIQAAALVAETLGVSPLEVGLAVGLKNTIDLEGSIVPPPRDPDFDDLMGNGHLRMGEPEEPEDPQLSLFYP